MKILMTAPQWPDPPVQGAAIRNRQIALYLAQRHDLYLLTFAPDVPPNRERLGAVCTLAEVVPFPKRSTLRRVRSLATSSLPDMAWRLYSPNMEARVRQLAGEIPFDAIHVEGIEMARYGSLARGAVCERWGHNPLLTYDAHNAEYLLQRRAFTTDLPNKRIIKALYSLAQWWRLRRFERRFCIESSHVLAVSEADRVALSHLAPSARMKISLLPNGVDPLYWSQNADFPSIAGMPANSLVFDGTMDFRPNVDAVLWFAAEVWPLVRTARPEAHFYIVGRNPAPDVLALGRIKDITVTGAVADTRGYVAAATVYVVPMRMGGGVRLKVLQAMSMGCAIVSTPMGAEGITVREMEDLLIARDAQAFSTAVLRLLDDAPLRARLGLHARQTVSSLYAWDTLLPALDRLYP